MAMGRKLEYDFVVAPGADPGRIRLSFKRAKKLAIDPGGNLLITTRLGDIIHQRPVAYQEIDGERRPGRALDNLIVALCPIFNFTRLWIAAFVEIHSDIGRSELESNSIEFSALLSRDPAFVGSGAFGIVIDHAAFPRTRARKASASPSGTQLSADGAFSKSVIFASAPLSIHRTKISGLPAPVDTYYLPTIPRSSW
jgi:hypothetical protein